MKYGHVVFFQIFVTAQVTDSDVICTLPSDWRPGQILQSWFSAAPSFGGNAIGRLSIGRENGEIKCIGGSALGGNWYSSGSYYIE